MTVLVTGAAGFIGYHLCEHLLARGERVVGVDSMNAYYDPRLKEARLACLDGRAGFTFQRLDIADQAAMADFASRNRDVTRIVNLAAQAGVRHSLDHPRDYIHSNIAGFLEILEMARRLPRIEHLVYASSSSVYGGNVKQPFAIEDKTDSPLALYGATKKANELMGHCYSHLFRIPATGLRFFTVYGPWGRPDMSAWLFTKAIFAGDEIAVFNNGDMKRDFTFVDDIVAGVAACLDKPPAGEAGGVPHRAYNLGNNRSEALMHFIGAIEKACGRQARIRFEPMQPGDVKETYADIAASTRDFGYLPRTTIDEGVPRFVAWFRNYHRL